MKILLTHRFFWPDTAPYGYLLRTIAQTLADDGHDVHVFSTVPSYRHEMSEGATLQDKDLGKITVKRIWMFSREKSSNLRRICNALIYGTALFFAVLRNRPNVVTAATTPPVIAAWMGSLAARLVGSKFIYHMQDIHPEVSLYSNGRLGRGLAFNLLRFLDNQTLRRSAAIVVLSPDMKETLEDRGLRNLPIEIIQNFSLETGDGREAPPPALRKPKGKVRVIFAGNLGRFQDLPRIAEGISLLFPKYPELELFFLGDGVALPELRKTWRSNPQVRFAGFLPFVQARVLLEEADIGLVALAPNIYRVAYPSKIATYLRLGLPLLACVEPHSALARDLVSSGVAEVPQTSGPEDIAAALERLIANPREAGSNTGDSEEKLKEKWQALVREIGGERQDPRLSHS